MESVIARVYNYSLYEPVTSNGFLLIKCLNMSVIYCVCISHNMHGYENNLCIMEAEVLSTYGKLANDTIVCFSSHYLLFVNPFTIILVF